MVSARLTGVERLYFSSSASYGVSLLNHMFGSWTKIGLLKENAPPIPAAVKLPANKQGCKNANGASDASPNKRVKTA